MSDRQLSLGLLAAIGEEWRPRVYCRWPPLFEDDGEEIVVRVLRDGMYAIVPLPVDLIDEEPEEAAREVKAVALVAMDDVRRGR